MSVEKFSNNGEVGLGFADVLIVPAHSDIKSRHSDEIDTSTDVARGLRLNNVIVTAGMDTVTGASMAIEVALHGGIGEIHRNNTPDQQVEMVERVKNRLRVVEENPPIVGIDATVGEAIDLLKKRERGYVIVGRGNEFNGEIAGIATPRDFKAARKDLDMPISSVMTPHIPNSEDSGQKRLITVRVGTTLEEAVSIMLDQKIQKIPILDNEGKLEGVYTLKDNEYYEEFPNASLDQKGRLRVGAAIGVRKLDIDRAHKLVAAGADMLFIDIAHGDSNYTAEMLSLLSIQMLTWLQDENIIVPVAAGNFGTKDGVNYACDNGADAVKVGIGPGFVCWTRNVAGAGIPQVTAIMDAREAMDSRPDGGVPIIADGGIREPGDVSKAIVAGADSVMIGSIFAGTSKSPGEIVYVDGKPQKQIRGMASQEVFNDRQKMGDTSSNAKQYAPEGRSTFTPYKGETSKIIFNYIGGLRSGMSYAGAHTIAEMRKARFIKVSSAGSGENTRSLS